MEWWLLVDEGKRISTRDKKIKEKNMKIFILLVAVSLERCSALYFHMGETEKKCFLEEIPDETMVTGTYDRLVGLNGPKLFVKTEVRRVGKDAYMQTNIDVDSKVSLSFY